MKTAQETNALATLKNGTSLDHITCGRALSIVKLLKLAAHRKMVTIGLNLESQKMGMKDLIKVDDWELSKEDADYVAILSPEMTVNIIRNYEVVHKFQVTIPKTIRAIFPCPNPNCITNHEQTKSRFSTMQQGSHVLLTCLYCNKTFHQHD